MVLPTVMESVNINTIRNGSLQIRLWKHKEDLMKLCGESWIAFPKLLREEKSRLYYREASIFSKNFSSMKTILPQMDIFKNVDEDVYYRGRKIGRVKGVLSLSGLPHIYQMLSGVNTEKGLMLQGPPIKGMSKIAWFK